MSGTKIDGSTYNKTYLTNYKNGENTECISGQVRVGVSVAAKNANLGVHYAIFKDLAVGTHNLEITYSGDSSSSVGYFMV